MVRLIDKPRGSVFAVKHVLGPRRRSSVKRDPDRARNTARLVLAALLVATSIGLVDDNTTAASPPAELISFAPGSTAPAPSTDSYSPSISGDGNVVVFNASSFASTLVETVFVRNRSAGTTTAVPSIAPGGLATGGVLSRDGCHVVFMGYTPSLLAASRWDVYTWNRCTPGPPPVRIAPGTGLSGNFPSFALSVSADGHYVAYVTTPSSGGPPHVARIDTSTTPATENVLTSPAFSSADSIDISDDGKFVAVGGQVPVGGVATYQVVGWTAPCTATCTTEVISLGPSGQPLSGFNDRPSVSADGRYVAFESDTADVLGAPPGATQVYVRDRVNAVTRLVTDTAGQPMIPTGIGVVEPDISPDGTQIALSEEDSGETSNVWVARSTSGYFNTAAFDLVSYGVSGNPVDGSGAGNPSMSATGRFVAFSSSASVELSGGAVPDAYSQVWMRLRAISLTSTPTIDFGTVDLGSQSTPKNATIANNSTAEVNIGSVTTTGQFNITVNGCPAVLASGAACNVTVVYQPSAAGPATGTLVVAGDGLSTTTSLTGTGRTPTGPTPGLLTITPVSAGFGSGPIGTSFPAKKFVVSNPGQAAVAIASVGLGGTGADQFAIVTNGCTGSLAPGGTCTIQVSATVTRDGSLTATLDVLGGGGQAAHATLRLGGLFAPTLKMNPGVVSAGDVTAAIGAGFPPNIDVQLAFEGEAPFATVHTDGDGAFRFDYLLLRHGVRIGGRQVVAVDQAEFSGVRAPLLIELAASRPTGFESPAITSGVRSLINRGG